MSESSPTVTLFSLEELRRSPIVFMLLMLTLGSQSIDYLLYNKTSENVHASTYEVVQLIDRIDAVVEQIAQNTERIDDLEEQMIIARSFDSRISTVELSVQRILFFLRSQNLDPLSITAEPHDP